MASTFRWAQGQVVGNYVVERAIAHGGMGEVYRAKHRRLPRVAAIKTLREKHEENLDVMARFEREAQVLERIEHPNVVRVWDFGEHDDTLYMAMEWLHGQTLAARLTELGVLGEPELVRILLQTCAGVSAAHEQGVVHRDLKPDNIFLVPGDPHAVVKVVDFGIASAGHVGAQGVVTATHAIYGTPYYMSPEQWSGLKNVTPASDQFSLGVIAYECATGKIPFAVEDPGAVLAMAAKAKLGDYPPLRTVRPQVSEAFAAIVARMLLPSPAQRYASMHDVGLALLALTDDATRETYTKWFAANASTQPSLPPEPQGTADLSDATFPSQPSPVSKLPVAQSALVSTPPRVAQPSRPTTLGGSIRVVDTDLPAVPVDRRAPRMLAGAAGALALVAVLWIAASRFGASRTVSAAHGGGAAPSAAAPVTALSTPHAVDPTSPTPHPVEPTPPTPPAPVAAAAIVQPAAPEAATPDSDPRSDAPPDRHGAHTHRHDRHTLPRVTEASAPPAHAVAPSGAAPTPTSAPSHTTPPAVTGNY